MPWTPADADKHVKGLNSHQTEVWAAVANRALQDCQKKGGSDCEGRAIRMANAQAQRVGKIAKLDPEKCLAFGYAYMGKTRDNTQIEDHSTEFVDEWDEMEDAAYAYVLESREGNDMHDGPVTGKIVESFVVTKDKLAVMGLEEDALPLGWWVGFKLEPEAFEKVKNGDRTAFSIEGRAERVWVDAL